MKKLITVLVAALAVSASPAYAVTLVNPDGSRAEPFQSWADGSTIALPAGRIVIDREADRCSSTALGCSTPDQISIRGDCTRGSVNARRRCRFVFWHELGHQYWMQTDPQNFATMIGADTTTMTEAAADVYALCALKRRRIAATDAWLVSPRKFRRACRTVALR